MFTKYFSLEVSVISMVGEKRTLWNWKVSWGYLGWRRSLVTGSNQVPEVHCCTVVGGPPVRTLCVGGIDGAAMLQHSGAGTGGKRGPE